MIVTEAAESEKGWRMKGLIFENCNCQIICQGHISYRQLCTHERCLGHWAIHIDRGQFNGVALDDLNIVILYDTPQLMISGGWTEVLYIDERANEGQRRAIEHILTGQAGGPWVVLSRFVTKRLETRHLPIHFEDQGRRKRMWVEGYFDTAIENLRGQDGSRDVLIENLFNQIHGSPQVIASGETSYRDGELAASTKGTHALYSHFSWAGP
jgi:hypothetical protein